MSKISPSAKCLFCSLYGICNLIHNTRHYSLITPIFNAVILSSSISVLLWKSADNRENSLLFIIHEMEIIEFSSKKEKWSGNWRAPLNAKFFPVFNNSIAHSVILWWTIQFALWGRNQWISTMKLAVGCFKGKVMK